MSKTIRIGTLPANAAYLLLAAAGGLNTDIRGTLLGEGPSTPVRMSASWADASPRADIQAQGDSLGVSQ
jgi:hypothetical protein